jgi:hypothetical protein
VFTAITVTIIVTVKRSARNYFKYFRGRRASGNLNDDFGGFGGFGGDGGVVVADHDEAWRGGRKQQRQSSERAILI